jgi:hypothetical protein
MRRILAMAIMFAYISIAANHGYGQNLVADYSFTGNADDQSDYGNHGTVNNAVLTTDRFGISNSAYEFDGTTTYIDMGNDPSLDLQDGFSISAWFNRFGNSGSAYQTIVSRGYPGNGDYWIGLHFNGANYVFEIYLDGEVFFSTTTVEDGWHHTALITETGTNGVKLYLDGILIEEFTSSNDLVGSSSFNLRIGNEGSFDADHFEGRIDEVSIYKKALSKADVNAIYSAFELNFETGAGFGNALHFKDVDYVSLPIEVVSDLNDFTFETWVKWDGGDENQRIFEFGYGNNEYVYLTANRFGILRAGEETLCFNGDCSLTIPVGDWHHIAVSYDNINNTVVIYLDGDEITRSESFSNDAVNIMSTFLPFNRIGSGAFTTNTFKGALDETRFWAVTRSQEEISSFINLPITGDEDNLIYYYSYDQGVANGDNTTMDKVLLGHSSAVNGDLSGFVLDGDESNFILSDVNTGKLIITGISPQSAIPGNEIVISGVGFSPQEGFNKVFIGKKEAQIVSERLNEIVVVVPDVDKGEAGNNEVQVLNSNGASQEFGFTTLLNGIESPYSYTETILVDALINANKVISFDANGDGYLDIVCSGAGSASGLRTLLLINDQNNEFPSQIEISIKGSLSLSYGDIDNDGDIDLLSSESDGNDDVTAVIVWYENDGNGIFSPHIIATNLSKASDLGDIDNDGDLDVVASLYADEKIVSYENIGGVIDITPIEIYSEPFSRIQDIHLADMEGDTDLDILTSDSFVGTDKAVSSVNIFYNTGSGSFGPRFILDDEIALVSNVATADFNDDGHNDLVISSNGSFASYWFSSLGNGSFERKSVQPAIQPTNTIPADLNADGSPDLLVANYYGGVGEGGLSAHINDGLGNFTRNEVAHGRFNQPNATFPVDIDSDGDLDIICTWLIDNKLVLYEHVFSSNDFTSFSLFEQVGDATINIETQTVDITVSNDSNLAKLYPVFTISDKAEIYLDGDMVESDFTSADFSEDGNYLFYTIVAENGDEEFWIVNVHPLPGVPDLFDAFNIEQNTADLDWTFPNFANSYQVEVSSDNFSTVYTFDTDVELLTAENLAAGTTYKARLRAVNDFGISEYYSNTISFTTVPPDTEIAGVAEISTDGAVIYWDAAKGAEQYGLDVGKDDFFTVYVGGYDDRGVSSLAESVVGLDPGTDYWVRLRSENESGVSLDSDVVTFLTLPETPAIEFILVEEQGVTLFWGSVKSAMGYEIESKQGDQTEFHNFAGDASNGEISGLLDGTSYSFRIRAINDTGSSLFSEIVTVVTIPPAAEISGITEISADGALVSWQAAKGAEQYGLDVAEDDFFSVYVGGYDDRGVSSLTESVVGLDPGTDYWVRLRSENESGVSTDSEVITFLTLPEAPTIEFILGEEQGVTLFWGSVKSALSYEIETKQEDQTEFHNFAGDANSGDIFGLLDGTSYSFRIRAINDTGSSLFSEIVTVVTIAPAAEISDITEISSDGAVVSWQAAKGAEQYALDVAKDDFFDTYVGGYDDRGVSSLTESVVGLDPGTDYWVRLRSENESGVSSDSEIVTFLTLPEAPSFDEYEIEQQKVILFWENVDSALDYEVEVSNGENVEVFNFGIDEEGEVSGLQEATEYRFRIRARNETGFSSYSDKVAVLTVSGTPQDMAISNLGQTSARLNWNAVTGAEFYSVELSENDFSSFVSGYAPKVLTSNNIDFEDLKPGVIYSVRVQSQNNSGLSTYSDTQVFTTLPATPITRSASSVTTTSFTANWDAVTGVDVDYTLEVSNNSNFQTIQFTETVLGALSFQFVDLPEGVSFWYRLRANNVSGSSSNSEVIFVEQPLLIRDLIFEELVSQSGFDALPITFKVTGGTNEFDVNLKYKGASDDTYIDRMVFDNNGYLFNASRSMFDDIGFTFQIEVIDGDITLASDVHSVYISDIDSEVPLKSLGEKWQMFSIPYVLEDNLITTVFDEMGPFEYKSEWRMMHYDGTKYVDAGSGLSKIELGKGYWFNSPQVVDIKFNNAVVNTEDPYSIDLRQGWNQVGNPYNLNISWNNVRNSNGVTGTVEPLIQFDADNQNFVQSDVLSSFGAGFVWSDAAVTVEVSSSEDKTGGRYESNDVTDSDIDGEQWILDLFVNDNQQRHEVAAVGMHPEASLSKDKFDRTALPRFFNYLEMTTNHEDYFFPWFSKDIVPTSEESSWLFELVSNYVDGQTTIEWDNESIQNTTKQLWLIDEESGHLINMNSTSSYTFSMSSSHQFSVHLSKDVSVLPIPYTLTMGDPYPNPTKDMSTVSVLLPQGKEDYTMELSIYDLRGQQVGTIVSGNFVPGVYSFTTELNDLEEIKNGVYLYRLSIQNSTIKPIYKKVVINK